MNLRDGLPPLPEYMKNLPISDKGYPIPWFVYVGPNGPDFRVIAPAKREIALKRKLCWICGDDLGVWYKRKLVYRKSLAFVAGPMCGINQISAEPPSHYQCAKFAALACPFLTLPKAQRREAGLPEGHEEIGSATHMIMRNPGVAMIWITNGDRKSVV